MSRIGRKTITVPQGVTVTAETGKVTVKGQKGEVSMPLPQGITVTVDGSNVSVSRESEERHLCEMHGTVRATLVNMIAGVKDGYSKGLEMVGVGYRVEPAGKNINLVLGFSHPVPFEAPEGVSFKVETPNRLVISGADKQAVGQVAAVIRKYRPPEPYKGKGILFAGEHVRRKAGKRTGK